MRPVVDKLRASETLLTDKVKTIHEHELVSVLKQIHDDVDAAVSRTEWGNCRVHSSGGQILLWSSAGCHIHACSARQLAVCMILASDPRLQEDNDKRIHKMPEFTPTQGRYLAFIHAYTESFGLPPAESEIAATIGVSPPSVNQMMKTLEKKGLIRRQPGVPRSIEILIDPDAIPKWKGKRITRTVKVWTLDRPAKQIAGRAGSGKGSVYRFKITLQDSDPAIWRRIETQDVTLEKLHELIQTAMGWTNSHCHQFEVAGTRYIDPRLMEESLDDFRAIEYSGIRVSDLVSEHGARLRIGYEYDFGDGWQHEVVLEQMTDSEPGTRYPRCIDGERACPPEDIGGAYGFADYVEAITNPDHSEHDELLDWHGPFDPSAFDVTQATRRMKKGLPVW